MSHKGQSFPWYETADLLAELVSRHGEALQADAEGRGFALAGDEDAVRLIPPAVLPPPRPAERAADYLHRLPPVPGAQIVLLLRAGAAALGLWQGHELLRHKVLRRYAVRGSGRAQTTHLKTKGKSRYGSRLRLQNHRRLLVEVNERLGDWWREVGGCEAVFHACPVRTWPELFGVAPPPPFDQRDPLLRRIPLHVHAPRYEELLRIRHLLETGSLETPDS